MVNLCIDRRGKGMEEGTNGKVVSVSRIHSSFRTCYIYIYIYFEHPLRRTRLNVLLERINKRAYVIQSKLLRDRRNGTRTKLSVCHVRFVER